MRHSIWSGLNLQTLEHAARTTVAATVSIAIARLLGMPQPHWAAISTMVVTQSTMGAALTVSGERFAGTALGALSAVLLVTQFGSNIWCFAGGVFCLGIVCAMLRLDRAAYRFAGITLAIIVFAARPDPARILALHRFLEVSLGIVTGLIVAALWPERDIPVSSLRS